MKLSWLITATAALALAAKEDDGGDEGQGQAVFALDEVRRVGHHRSILDVVDENLDEEPLGTVEGIASTDRIGQMEIENPVSISANWQGNMDIFEGMPRRMTAFGDENENNIYDQFDVVAESLENVDDYVRAINGILTGLRDGAFMNISIETRLGVNDTFFDALAQFGVSDGGFYDFDGKGIVFSATNILPKRKLSAVSPPKIVQRCFYIHTQGKDGRFVLYYSANPMPNNKKKAYKYSGHLEPQTLVHFEPIKRLGKEWYRWGPFIGERYLTLAREDVDRYAGVPGGLLNLIHDSLGVTQMERQKTFNTEQGMGMADANGNDENNHVHQRRMLPLDNDLAKISTEREDIGFVMGVVVPVSGRDNQVIAPSEWQLKSNDRLKVYFTKRWPITPMGDKAINYRMAKGDFNKFCDDFSEFANMNWVVRSNGDELKEKSRSEPTKSQLQTGGLWALQKKVLNGKIFINIVPIVVTVTKDGVEFEPRWDYFLFPKNPGGKGLRWYKSEVPSYKYVWEQTSTEKYLDKTLKFSG